MEWIGLSLFSALLLGFYDLAKKHAVADNAVLPVLFFSIAGASSSRKSINRKVVSHTWVPNSEGRSRPRKQARRWVA